MKKITILACLIIITLSCKGQQIIPLEKLIEYRDTEADIVDGTYLKDINGLLDKYLGTWKGNYDNINYTFIFTKNKSEIRGLFIDQLYVRYLITTTTGNVIEDTRSLPNADVLIIKGDYISKSLGYYVLNYFGKNTECGQSGEVFISTTKDNKQMKLFLAAYQGIIDGSKCPKVTEQILPTKSMFLSKQ
ncbi:DUF6705 family protein [Flavobacterium poyangense]|uniref:DUF6705 family protein n=1 Tax=Flavobacterium poyangense TaxID=2204302 RepID=UPI00141FC537|nr:DUF6705 family protein [Flavobacterium sp. JXAS1]